MKNKLYVLLLIVNIGMTSYAQDSQYHIYSTKPIQVTGTTNCPGVAYCIHHSSCEFQPFFMICYDKNDGRYYCDVFISDKNLDYYYMVRMPHTIKINCKKGGNIVSEGKIHFKKDPTYRIGYSTEVHDDFSVTVTTPHHGTHTYYYNVKYNDPNRFHAEGILDKPGEVLMRFPITKDEYNRIMGGVKKINISNFKDYYMQLYVDRGDYEIKTKTHFNELVQKQFSKFTQTYDFCQ